MYYLIGLANLGALALIWLCLFAIQKRLDKFAGDQTKIAEIHRLAQANEERLSKLLPTISIKR